jgi:hypothetical protein
VTDFVVDSGVSNHTRLTPLIFYICRFTTDNFYSMEFDPFDLAVKELTTKRVLIRYDSTGPFYTLPLHASLAST